MSSSKEEDLISRKNSSDFPLICVTGPMAAGKNAAGDILLKKGFAVTDADIIAHRAVENAKEKILAEFGTLAAQKNISLLNEDGTINRRAVGALIFGDEDLVARQEAIVYPEINFLLEQFIQEHKDCPVAVNATVLYKVPLIKRMDFVLFVDAPVFIRFFRALKRDRMKPKQILDRFARQKNLFAKYKNSNADIRRVWNTGTIESLEKKIDSVLTKCR